MHLERFGRAPVLGAQRVDALHHVSELGGVAARVDPAVTGARRAPQRDVGVTTDEERYRADRGGTDLAALELQQLTVVFEPTARREAAQDVDHLVHARAAALPRNVHRREVLGPGADAHAQP